MAKHFFCSVCGVKSFYVPRSHPDGYSVNGRCLDAGTVEGLMIEPFNGREWERQYPGGRGALPDEQDFQHSRVVSQLAFRSAEGSDAQGVAELVQLTFLPPTLPGWTTAAVDKLFEENSPGALSCRFETAAFAHVCVCDGLVVGYIDCKLPRLLSLLVVHPSFQRHGIGSQLLERALEHIQSAAPDVSVVEVNATEYSIPFYRRCAFYPISEPIEYEGCRFVRMGFWRKSPLLKGT